MTDVSKTYPLLLVDFNDVRQHRLRAYQEDAESGPLEVGERVRAVSGDTDDEGIDMVVVEVDGDTLWLIGTGERQEGEHAE